MLNDWIEDMIKDISHTVETDLVDPSIKCSIIRTYYKAYLLEAREKIHKEIAKDTAEEYADYYTGIFNKTFGIDQK